MVIPIELTPAASPVIPEVIHGCDQRAPLVEFYHPALETPLRFEQRGAPAF